LKEQKLAPTEKEQSSPAVSQNGRRAVKACRLAGALFLPRLWSRSKLEATVASPVVPPLCTTHPFPGVFRC